MQSRLYCYQITSTHLLVLTRLWRIRQGKLLLTHGIFENAGWKPVRGRFHGCGTLTFKEVLIHKYNLPLYPFCEW